MAWVAPVGKAALKYGPAVLAGVKGLFGGGGEPDWASLERWLSTQRAQGYLSPEDVAAGDRTQSRLVGSAEDAARGERYGVLARYRQRGLGEAPAAEATSLQRVAQNRARGVEQAGNVAADQNYSTWLGNKSFEQSKILALAQARLGSAMGKAQRGTLERAGAMNSLLQYIPSLMPGGKQADGLSPTTSKRRYNPATGMMEDVPSAGFGASPDALGNDGSTTINF